MSDSEHISFDEALERIPPITLGEMDSVKLLNRIDTKYLTDEDTLLAVLEDAARNGYRALEAQGAKVSPYDSVYFDTDGMQMYLDHHNERLTRQKVRTRSYVNSGDAFLEIKRKNNKGRTSKKRTSIPLSELGDFRGDPRAEEYLASHSAFTSDKIAPSVETSFKRITLVNESKTERLTIDTCLYFKNLRTLREASLRDAVIIELKQDGREASRMKGILLDHRVKPLRISKYCLAVALTDPGIKSGRFKPKVRAVEKIIDDKIETIC